MKSFADTIELAVEAQVPLMAWGRHGVGKTAGVASYAKRHGHHLITFIISQKDPLVIGGYPGREESRAVIPVDREGKPEDAKFVTTFAMPEWVQTIWLKHNEGIRTVLFLDEFNRGDQYAMNACMSLVQDKEVNGHKLPDDTIIVAACNPESPNDVVEPLTDPMIDRFAHIPVRADVKVWADWGKQETDGVQNIDPVILDFVTANNSDFNAFEFETSDFAAAILNRVGPTPRSWHAVSRVKQALEDYGESNTKMFAVASTLIRGLVGADVARNFVSYLKDNFVKAFTTKEMLSGSKKVLKRAEELVDRGLVGVINASIEKAREEIPALAASKKGDLDLSGFWKFFSLVPKDQQVAWWYLDAEKPFWHRHLAEGKVPKEIMAIMNRNIK